MILPFLWFAAPRYWSDRIQKLQGQIAAMVEPPLELS